MKATTLLFVLVCAIAPCANAIPHVPDGAPQGKVYTVDDSVVTYDYIFTTRSTVTFCPPGGGHIDFEREVVINAHVKLWDLRGLQPYFNREYGPGAPMLIPALAAVILKKNTSAFDTTLIKEVWNALLYRICFNMCESEFGSVEDECLTQSSAPEVKENGPLLIKSPYGSFLLTRTITYRRINATTPLNGP